MSEQTDRPLRVFLCHSSSDKLIVRELYRQLDSEGWMDVWLDSEKLYPGHDWSFEIEQAVEAADAILVCLSKNSVTKEGYVQRELRIVLDLADYKPEGTLFVIPVRLEECEPPRRLRNWQYADYFPKEARDRAYQRLLVSLRMRAKRLGLSTEDPAKEGTRREAEENAHKEAEDRARKGKEDRDKKAAEYHDIKVAEEKARKYREEQKGGQPEKHPENLEESEPGFEKIAQPLSKLKESPFHRELYPNEVKGEASDSGKKKSSRKPNLFPFFIGAILLLALLCGMYGINYIIQNSFVKDIPTQTETTAFVSAPAETLAPSPFRSETPLPAFDYTVSSSDTCADIAVTFGVSVQSIIALNDLHEPCLISAGQVIKIPHPTPTLDFGDLFNPQGTPVEAWRDIPIMLQATAGSEYDADNYSFKADVTIQEVQDYYKAQLKDLGWNETFSMPADANGAIMVFSKDSIILTITITSRHDSTVVILTLA